MSEVDITTPEDNATYESEKDRLIREIRDIENYLAALRTKLYELED